MIEQVEVRARPGIPYPVNRGSGYSNPDMRWRWSCAVCGFTCEDRQKEDCQRFIDEHVAHCTAGWCPIPMTVDRMMFSVLPHVAEPTNEDRERWNRLREANKRRG